MFKLILSFFILSFSLSAISHPVIFKDGFVISSFNMPSFSDNQLLYSFNPKWATGLNHWRFTKNNNHTEIGLARLNHLLWRKNSEFSQANVYLLSGIGIMDSEIDKKSTREAYLGGFEADWETRNLYAALKYYYFTSPAVSDLEMTQFRLGFSPYEAPFEELQTWFMIQTMYTPKINSQLMITPMLRFFYKNVLWEIGSSSKGDWMLNLMVHF